ncbi:MAG: hypothetical protein KDI01_04355 [Halioglobus sp.]|nr:hypothetical protein [Halioglobus sp.]
MNNSNTSLCIALCLLVTACGGLPTATVLNPDALSDDKADLYPEVATDGQGNWIVSWQRNDNRGRPGILSMHSNTDGKNWSLMHGTAGDGSHSPDLVSDGRGGWRMFLASHYPQGQDTDIVMLYSTPADWVGAVPKGFYTLHYNAAAGRVSDLVNSDAATDKAQDDAPVTATDGNRWVVLWQRADPLPQQVTDKWRTAVYAAASLDDGKTWSAPAPVSTPSVTGTGDARPVPDLAFGRGAWLAVWSDRDPVKGDYDIYYAFSLDGLTWKPPAALNTNAATDSGDDTGPRVATDGRGHWRVVWTSTDSLGPAGLGTDSDLLYADYTANTIVPATWSAPQPVDTGAASDTALDTDDSARIVYHSGKWHVVWDHRGTIYHTVSNASGWQRPSFAHREGAGGILSNGKEFAPAIALAGAFHYLIVWSSNARIPGEVNPATAPDYDIFLVRKAP